ncbi:MAG: hypothetical protein KME20_26785 [Kaiparowitsia implicata GSE-PSE-MK54-09C]|jgi:hypothetical protein|nr:hypothetical protein [Kaiparowitsia implicata GSE-PSE-MK54-09C]
MPKKPSRVIVVTDINQIMVSSDPSEGALINLEIPDEANLELRLPASALAKLEAMLASANLEQAKFQKMH